MKKNKMMRIASILLVAVLLTTSIISGTFAKYVTSGEYEDQARVAKFGVLVTAAGDLFDVTYKTTENTPGNSDGSSPDYDEGSTTTLSVESSNGDKLVAPGTKNTEGLTFGVTGTPEVDVNIKIDFEAVEDVFLAQAENLPDMTKAVYDDDEQASAYSETFDNEDDYYPLVFTLEGDYLKELEEEDLQDIEGLNTEDLEDGIVSGTLDAIADVFDVINNGGDGIDVDANTDLSDASEGGIGSFTLTWEWDFDDAGEGTYDKQDTLLGDLAALEDLDSEDDAIDALEALTDGDDYNLNVEVSLSITVTQID